MSETPSSSSTPEQLRQAQGILGFVKTLGTATEHFFRRLYHGLDRQTDLAPQIDELIQQQKHWEARARAREAEAMRLNAILSSMGEGVIMQDMDGRIIMMNDAARTLLGSQKAFWESDLGRRFVDSLSLRDLQSEFELVGEPFQIQINNRILAVQIAAVAEENGARLGTVIVLHDVTRAALAERLKNDFITQVSHELRTPLTAIKGMSDVMLTQPGDRPPNRRFLEAISRNVEMLDRMIVELLDISEISAGTFAVRRETVVLNDLFWGVINSLKPRLERAKLEVHFAALNSRQTVIIGDNRRLRWAFGHVLENSINYTLPGGVITIQTGEIRQGRVLTHIHDTGVGISDVDLPHIFERFYRGQARTPGGKLIDPRGLGQGLFVARAVAEAHGGYLSVASKVGVGSTFTFALPIAGPGAPPQAAEPPIDAEATARNPALALPPKTD